MHVVSPCELCQSALLVTELSCHVTFRSTPLQISVAFSTGGTKCHLTTGFSLIVMF